MGKRVMSVRNMAANHTKEELKEMISRRTNRHHFIGVDSDGRDHYADPLIDHVWTVVNGEVEKIVKTKSVERWVDHINEEVGWENCRYSTESTAEWLANEIVGDSRE